jgi:hypothetical protein
MSAEIAAIRRRDPDVDAGDITIFTFPLLIRGVGLLAVGVVPLIVIRNSRNIDALLVPVVGSLALAIICTAVVAWLAAIVISGLVVMMLYRTKPRASSQLVARTLTDSFDRVSDITSHITLLALVAGLVSLAIGLPTRRADELSYPVLEDLLAAQVAVLLAALGFAFVAESVRSAATPRRVKKTSAIHRAAVTLFTCLPFGNRGGSFGQVPRRRGTAYATCLQGMGRDSETRITGPEKRIRDFHRVMEPKETP